MPTLPACSRESRSLGPGQPQTPPSGFADPRITYFEDNLYQTAQGGRYFSWYGCAACHGTEARGERDLIAVQLRHSPSFVDVYASIAHHRGVSFGHDGMIPTEQLWQLAAYVRSLRALKREQRRRQDLDQAGEPQAMSWSGTVR
ncbi:c-type cytochrome [Flavisphingomonas formosensis]|uniref:c-type cytochrome n=1 Tax=Flavisphingomonas formosensis TaxID=861534 RepID=UPI0012FC34BF|nr:hypothetical protein [Sphingomonas formosensis]